eukprot:7597034-Alexandrium_andersonii.AAC.1
MNSVTVPNTSIAPVQLPIPDQQLRVLYVAPASSTTPAKLLLLDAENNVAFEVHIKAYWLMDIPAAWAGYVENT